MSLASIFSILAMLLILGMFFVITMNINLFTEVVKQDYDQIEVYMADGTTKADAQELMAQIREHEGVTSERAVICWILWGRTHCRRRF